MFNIGFWNVHGLNEHKSENLNDTSRNLHNFSPPLIIKATKRKRLGRPFGGIAVYCVVLKTLTLILPLNNMV
jgi:hypothetical protein